MAKAVIHIIKNRIYPANTYFITKGDRCVIIDPGLDSEKVLKALEEYDLTPIAILATHGHFDHIGSAEAVRLKYNIPFYIHAFDARLCKSANFFLKLAKIDHKIQSPIPTNIIDGGEVSLVIEDFEFEIANYPGHTDGSCVIRYKESLFTGDSLYAEYFFTNKFHGENLDVLRNSIRIILKKYPDELMVYPGHGVSNTLKNIKEHNRELEEFLAHR